jgi:hypothetical protein
MRSLFLRPLAILPRVIEKGCVSLFIILLLAACATSIRLSAVPQSSTHSATFAGIPNARFYTDEIHAPAMAAEGLSALRREQDTYHKAGHKGPLPPAYYLVVSGGGDNGAFGSGLLCGWGQRGDRPSFKLVTGVSTGALIAPLIFVGAEVDKKLCAMYTTLEKRDVFVKRGVAVGLLTDALTDNTPLLDTIGQYLDQALLERIAQEYRKGRLLLIGTTNLDAGRPVIWNIGAIADSGNPEALDLVRRILLASASIPGFFPPVMFDVSVDGESYQEMHVDGGVVVQAFLYPPSIDVRSVKERLSLRRKLVLYIIRNGKLAPDWTEVEQRTLKIAGRAVSTMTSSSGVNDTFRMFLTTRRDGIDFNLAYIGEDFDFPHTELFEPAYMNALFEYGHRLGRAGYLWKKAPPGYVSAK